jgi:paraquat-inducible protein B
VKLKTHPRLVGAFVLGAIALVLAAIVALSSGSWLARKDYFTVYFPGSVRGLNTGAAVTFRGVKVGKVDDVKAFLTGRPDPLIQIEVVIEIWGNVVETPEGMPQPFARAGSSAEFAQGLINRGVRARMMSQSLLTGQKYIELDFLPREPARFAGLRPRYPELPTTPTAMDRMSQKVEDLFERISDLPLDRMLENLERALQSLRTLLESPDLNAAIVGARRSTETLQPLLQDTRSAVGDARRLMDTLGSEAKDTGGEARETVRQARARLERLEGALASLENTLRGADDTRMTAAQTLDELNRTLKAVRNLVDYIQTHPEAVVLGKERAKEKP